jgi:hypothetical protein
MGYSVSGFVPPKPIRELHDMMRYRRKLVESQAAERNRLLKVLETANIKLANVATDDVFGMSGRLMLRARLRPCRQAGSNRAIGTPGITNGMVRRLSRPTVGV